MYRLLLAFGVLTIVIGLAFFVGGFMVDPMFGRPAIVRGLAIITCGLCVIALCDIQRRVVGLKLALDKLDRDNGRLMEMVVRQGHTIDAFRAEMAERLTPPPPAPLPYVGEEPVPGNGFVVTDFPEPEKLNEQPY